MLSLSLDELGAHPFPLWSVVAEGSWPRQGFTFSSKDELGLALRKLVSELLLTDAKHWFTDAQALRAQGDTFHATALAAPEAATASLWWCARNWTTAGLSVLPRSTRPSWCSIRSGIEG
jgi:hypothetical protein